MTTRQEISIAQTIIAIIVGSLTAFYLITLPNIYKEFSETFSSFGAEIPAATIFALKYSYLFLLLIPVPIAHFLHIHATKDRKKFTRAIVCQVIFLIMTVVFTISLMYLPIFSIGKVI